MGYSIISILRIGIVSLGILIANEREIVKNHGYAKKGEYYLLSFHTLQTKICTNLLIGIVKKTPWSLAKGMN